MSDLHHTIETKKPGAYQRIHQADPTGGRHMPWLGQLFIDDKLKLEDLPKATEYLKAFDKYRRHQLARKSLEQYADLPDLFSAVQRYLPNQPKDSGNVSQPLRDDIITLYDKDGLSVRIPLSADASRQLGKHTEWCTAYDKAPNQFWNYATKGPLLVVTTPKIKGKNERYQLHFQTGQINDETDKAVSGDKLLEKYPELVPVLEPYALSAVKQGGSSIQDVPREWRNDKLYETDIAQNGSVLKLIPENLREENLCEVAVADYGPALEFVPKDLRSKALCKKAVLQDNLAFKYVPGHITWDEGDYRDFMVSHIQKSREHDSDSNLSSFDFEIIPNHLQDKVMAAAGLGFDDKGFCIVREPACWVDKVRNPHSVPNMSGQQVGQAL